MVRLILLAALVAAAGVAQAEVPESTADRVRHAQERLYLFHFSERTEPDAALVDSMFGEPRVVVESPRLSAVPSEPRLTVKSGNLSLDSAVTSIATAVGYTAMYLNASFKMRVGYVPKVSDTAMSEVMGLLEDIYGVRIYVFPESRLLMVSPDGPGI